MSNTSSSAEASLSLTSSYIAAETTPRFSLLGLEGIEEDAVEIVDEGIATEP